MSCLDLLQRLRHTIQLLNTLHVLGLQMTLWYVIQFAQCGHTLIFGDTTICIIMDVGRPESFELRLSHPFYQPREHPFGYCIKLSTYANCVTTTGSVNATPAPIKEFEEGPVVTGPTREFEEGPVTEPTYELQEEPVAPTYMYNDSVLLDSGAHNHISLDAAPSDPAALFDNLTHLPNTFKKDDYGVPLLQMEASSGYTVSGKLFYEEHFASIIANLVIDKGLIVAKVREAPTDASPMAQSKRGVGNPSGVPGKSHVCSNVDETAPRYAAVSFALDLLCDGVSLVQITPSSTISPQVESCSLG